MGAAGSDLGASRRTLGLQHPTPGVLDILWPGVRIQARRYFQNVSIMDTVEAN